MQPDTRLEDVCRNLYFPLRLSIRSENTRYQYLRAIRCFGESLGRPATLSDLHDDLLTIWMGRLLDRKPALSADTVRERVGRVTTLWNWLARRGDAGKFPTILRPPAPDPAPLALSESQLRSLFASAAKERGTISGVPAALWWTSFFGFVWCSAERKSAALSVRVEWIDFDSRLCSIPPEVRKGRRKWGFYVLWPELLPLLRAALASDPSRDLMWPWPKCKGSYYTAYDRILRDAGIPVSRKTKTHSLRVSHATYLKVLGGDPTRKLMHGDSATTNRHYIDARLLPPDETRLFIPWAG